MVYYDNAIVIENSFNVSNKPWQFNIFLRTISTIELTLAS